VSSRTADLTILFWTKSAIADTPALDGGL